MITTIDGNAMARAGRGAAALATAAIGSFVAGAANYYDPVSELVVGAGGEDGGADPGDRHAVAGRAGGCPALAQQPQPLESLFPPATFEQKDLQQKNGYRHFCALKRWARHS